MELKTKGRNNKRGGNQWLADPRDRLFLAYFMDPKSKTFGNALQSGLKAGFSQKYAENILYEMPDWLREKQGKDISSTMLQKAERNLEEALDLPSKVHAMGAFGPLYEKTKKGKGKNAKVTKKAIMVHAPGLLKIKMGVSTFVAETVGKDKYGKDAAEGNRVLIINVSGETASRYGIKENLSKEGTLEG